MRVAGPPAAAQLRPPVRELLCRAALPFLSAGPALRVLGRTLPTGDTGRLGAGGHLRVRLLDGAPAVTPDRIGNTGYPRRHQAGSVVI
ncbi:hypothetical protein FAGKG844_440005 [Frankia sp. AgKG'84/4]